MAERKVEIAEALGVGISIKPALAPVYSTRTLDAFDEGGLNVDD